MDTQEYNGIEDEPVVHDAGTFCHRHMLAGVEGTSDIAGVGAPIRAGEVYIKKPTGGMPMQTWISITGDSGFQWVEFVDSSTAEGLEDLRLHTKSEADIITGNLTAEEFGFRRNILANPAGSMARITLPEAIADDAPFTANEIREGTKIHVSNYSHKGRVSLTANPANRFVKFAEVAPGEGEPEYTETTTSTIMPRTFADFVATKFTGAEGVTWKWVMVNQGATDGDFGDLLERITNLETAVVNIGTEIDALEAKDVEHDAAIEALEAKDLELETAVAANTAAIQNNKDDIVDLDARLDELELIDHEGFVKVTGDTMTGSLQINQTGRGHLVLQNGTGIFKQEVTVDNKFNITDAAGGAKIEVLQGSREENGGEPTTNIWHGLNLDGMDVKPAIEALEGRVGTNETNIATNTAAIEAVVEDVAANTADIEALKPRVEQNETNIITNRDLIDANTEKNAEQDERIDNHETWIDGAVTGDSPVSGNCFGQDTVLTSGEITATQVQKCPVMIATPPAGTNRTVGLPDIGGYQSTALGTARREGNMLTLVNAGSGNLVLTPPGGIKIVTPQGEVDTFVVGPGYVYSVLPCIYDNGSKKYYMCGAYTVA